MLRKLVCAASSWPLRGPRRVHGCLELLNPFGVAEFEDWHLEAAQMLGARLASRLG